MDGIYIKYKKKKKNPIELRCKHTHTDLIICKHSLSGWLLPDISITASFSPSVIWCKFCLIPLLFLLSSLFFHCFHSLPVLYHFCIVEHIFSFSSILNLPAVILLQLSHQSCLLAMLFCLSILGWGSVTDYNVLSHRKFHYSYTQAIVFCHFPIFSLTPLVRSNH